MHTGRAVARIFHGISSPAFPAYDWHRTPQWGAYVGFAFQDLMRLANIILQRRAGRAGAPARRLGAASG
jgi:hypothetical protein